MLSNVVLPDPEGPSSVRNSPCGMSRSVGWRAATPPNALLIPANWTVLTGSFPAQQAVGACRTEGEQQHHRGTDGDHRCVGEPDLLPDAHRQGLDGGTGEEDGKDHL